MKKFDYLIYIGRFQPFHNGHFKTVLEALEQSEKLIIVIGSAFSPRTPKNPWTVEERITMIQDTLKENNVENWEKRVIFTFNYDYIYDDVKWTREIKARVRNLIPNPNSKIGVIGLYKDSSSYYLKLFNEWTFVPMEEQTVINATDIRRGLFEHFNWGEVTPHSVYMFLTKWRNTDEYQKLFDEYYTLKMYKSLWKDTPFPPTFNTVDVVLIQNQHVLMVKRKYAPGKGLWALVGGFLDVDEFAIESAVRELKEETGIEFSSFDFKNRVKEYHVFDHPSRSQRGRTITHAFHSIIPYFKPSDMLEVIASDDAEEAKWIPTNNIDKMRDVIYEDHLDIINHFIKK